MADRGAGRHRYFNILHVKAAERAWSVYQDHEERLRYIMDHNGGDREQAEAVLDKVDDRLSARRARAQNLVDAGSVLFAQYPHFASVFHSVAGIAFLGLAVYLAIVAPPPLLVQVVLVGSGVINLAWGIRHFHAIRSSPSGD